MNCLHANRFPSLSLSALAAVLVAAALTSTPVVPQQTPGSESPGLKSLMQSARSKLASAKGQFGAGLNFTLGEGNLVF